MLTLFKRNKKDFFDALYRRYADQLFLLILRYVVSEFDAEEVLQRGFIKAYEHLNKFDHQNEKATKGWLYKIMINESLLFLREQKRLVFPDNLLTIEHQVSQNPEAEATLNYEACLKLVRQLPDGYRAVFNLFVIEGYSHKEIATSLNITEGTSRSQLNKARTLLQKKIKTLDYETELVG